MELPVDFRRTAERVPRYVAFDMGLDAETQGALRELAARAEGDLLAAGLAVLAALLHRHTQQPDLRLAAWQTESSGDLRRCTVTATLSDEATTDAVVAQIHRAAAPSAMSATDGDGTNIVFGLARGEADAGPGPTSLAREVELELALIEGTAGLRLRVTYDSSLFREDRAREFARQYGMLAHGAAAAPGASPLEPSLITDAARPLLPDPTQKLERPAHPLLTESFLACAAHAPAQTAIRESGRDHSYAHLAETSARLAAHLVAIGVRAGDAVAVTGSRGFALVSAMLGVFRSGGTLLTLDPRLPVERRKTMVEQAGAKVVLFVGADGAVDALRAAGWHSVVIDPVTATLDRPATHGEVGALPELDPAQPAYVFFTSGSTGVPKGVRGTHGGLAHFLAWQRQTFGIRPTDRASQLTALSFDVVLRDTFLALTSGATLCIPAEADVIDPPKILAWLAAERVSIVHVVPSLARLWLSHAPPGLALPDLRCVFFAGEPLMEALVRRFRQVGATALIVNLYGPTETTLAKCFYRVPDEPHPGVQPIGHPLPQTQVILLNRRRKPCGVGEIGEIAIRTPFRTLGYVNSPELTARVFVQNSATADPDDLIYLTGDSGRYRPDGLLEILGRIDNQVKIRGVRIEPGEIEAALGQHARVREAVVVARDDVTEAKILVAYVVLAAPVERRAQAEVVSDLRAFLRARLPETMVPAAYVLLPAIPLNANGKVDRKALPPPERLDVPDGGAPSTALEEQLAAIWAEVLGIRSVGINESFFDLGGDSLTAMGVLLRMRGVGVDDSICRAILQGRTIAEIAGIADGRAPARTGPPPADVQSRLLMGVMRGLLALLLVASHWMPWLFRHLPPRLAPASDAMWFLLNWPTPGYALAFGMMLGFTYAPIYRVNPSRARALLLRGAAIVAVGVAVFGIDHLVINRVDSKYYYHPLASPLTYYTLALLTAPAWLRLMTSRTWPVAKTLAVGAAFLLVHLFLRSLHPGEAWAPLVGKYSYFNMSAGAFGGAAIGLDLRRRGRVPRWYFGVGVAMVVAGIGLTWGSGGPRVILTESIHVEPFRWFLYAGLTLSIMPALDSYLQGTSGAGRPMGPAIQFVEVLGQLTLAVYFFDFVSRDLGKFLELYGSPSLHVLVSAAMFFGVMGVLVRRTHRLYHGEEPASLRLAPTPSRVRSS